MLFKIIKPLKQLFCDHTYTYEGKYGVYHVDVCIKCGKIVTQKDPCL